MSQEQRLVLQLKRLGSKNEGNLERKPRIRKRSGSRSKGYLRRQIGQYMPEGGGLLEERKNRGARQVLLENKCRIGLMISNGGEETREMKMPFFQYRFLQ